MVGLVLVSHSPDLVRGLRELLAQMDPDVPVAIAGGTDDGGLGTSLELITAALDDADRGDGAIVLYDLGSAEMTAETALEFLDDERRERCLLVDAPLVEGALAALGSAGGGAGVGAVAAAARSVCDPAADTGAASHDDERGTDPVGRASSGVGRDSSEMADDAHPNTAEAHPGGGAATEPPDTAQTATDRGATDAGGAADGDREEHATLRLRNTQGLHARPAAQIVRALRGLDARVQVQRADGDQRANAASALALVGLGATAGTTVVVRATGPQAEEAVGRVRALIEDGFGEPLASGEEA